MSAKPVYLTSDVHLGAVSRDTEAAFRSWLLHAGREASKIVINGDLFDFWFEYRSVIPRGHLRVLGALAEIADSGVPILFMGGNHDWWGGSFLEQEVGMEVRRAPTVLDLAGRRTFLAHGDGLGKGDLGYRMLKLVLRGRLTRWAFRRLHPDLGAWIARRVSQTEVRTGGPTESEKDRARFLAAWANQKLRTDPGLDLVVLGHTHIPTLVEVQPDRYYLNAGDWIHHRSYAVLREGERPVLESWTG